MDLFKMLDAVENLIKPMASQPMDQRVSTYVTIRTLFYELVGEVVYADNLIHAPDVKAQISQMLPPLRTLAGLDDNGLSDAENFAIVRKGLDSIRIYERLTR